ncbi:ARPP-2 domain-containing protein [Streptosporangium longisporum]|uniref:ARG and Rhodanese-Phosphatase-superfamily-associated domain-containing protein n=1 Tax=Streptosporangium longisporum TaxID=46187 RepID=A0ABN3Y5I4_9ACTN
MTDLALTGLTTHPAQAWGGVRLVPLVRAEPIEDLRLDARLYDTELGVVEVGPRTEYVSYIPHGFVATWTDDGTPASAYGTQLRGPRERDRPPGRMPLRFHRRMARRAGRNRLRFLPLHLALEGYLALHFGGPEIVWEEWSQRAISHGLSPRAEEAYTGAQVGGLEDALRVFEIHSGQCGVLVYVADALAAAFVVPHPDDYRALHTTLVHDLYGELIFHYAMFGGPVADFRARIEDATVRSLADLRAGARRQRDEWAAFHDRVMAGGLLDGDHTYQRVHEMGGYRLSRFLPSFERRRENHIGELITDGAGRLAYLKTFRLSENQVRRGHLLTSLAATGWNLADAAAALGVTEPQLGLRIEAAGFGHLLRQDILDHYRARARRDRR